MAGFAEPGIGAAGWLYAADSRDLRCGRIVPIVRHGVRLVVWRDGQGRAACAIARCPHWGADLAGGRVQNGRLTCPLHGWSFAADGSCAEGRSAHVLSTVESGGQVFVWWGQSAPLFPLPGPELPAVHRSQRVRPCRVLDAHPHLVTSNGFDLAHWRPVHDLEASVVQPLTAIGEWGLRMTVRLAGGAGRWLPGPAPELTITTWGATLCTISTHGWWGRSWTMLANVEEAPGCYRAAQQITVDARWPGTGWLILLGDAVLAGLTLAQDRAALSGWQPRREALTGQPWDRYLPLVERLPTWRPD